MIKPPSHFSTMFTLEWILDLFFYGLFLGALCFANYIIVIYGYNQGNNSIGIDCNSKYDRLDSNDDCRVVYRARAASYASLLIMLMLHSLVCKHLQKS